MPSYQLLDPSLPHAYHHHTGILLFFSLLVSSSTKTHGTHTVHIVRTVQYSTVRTDMIHMHTDKTYIHMSIILSHPRHAHSLTHAHTEGRGEGMWSAEMENLCALECIPKYIQNIFVISPACKKSQYI